MSTSPKLAPPEARERATVDSGAPALPTGRRTHRPLTDARKAAFLAALKQTGVLRWSAKAASPGNPDGAYSTFIDETKRDPAFALQVQEALSEFDESLVRECTRRAVEGVPNFKWAGNGDLCQTPEGEPAVVLSYSDRLLERLLAARMPAQWSERRQIEHSGTVGHGDADKLFISPSDLMALSLDERRNLAGILEKISASRRGEPLDVTPQPIAIEHQTGDVVDVEADSYDMTELERVNR